MFQAKQEYQLIVSTVTLLLLQKRSSATARMREPQTVLSSLRCSETAVQMRYVGMNAAVAVPCSTADPLSAGGCVGKGRT
jgi:hypothetical protein